MSQGRGSALGAAVVVALALIYLLAQAENARAANLTVGDSGGWTFNVKNWPAGKEFKAGDTLIFKYVPVLHNVVVVDKGGHDLCLPSMGAKFFISGNDQITLAKGMNYFICATPGHCAIGGMKIAVNAA